MEESGADYKVRMREMKRLVLTFGYKEFYSAFGAVVVVMHFFN